MSKKLEINRLIADSATVLLVWWWMSVTVVKGLLIEARSHLSCECNHNTVPGAQLFSKFPFDTMYHKWFSRRNPGKKSSSWTHLRNPPATKHAGHQQSTLSDDTWWTRWSWAKYLEWYVVVFVLVEVLVWVGSPQVWELAWALQVGSPEGSHPSGEPIRAPDFPQQNPLVQHKGVPEPLKRTQAFRVVFHAFILRISSHFTHIWWLMTWTVCGKLWESCEIVTQQKCELKVCGKFTHSQFCFQALLLVFIEFPWLG